MDTSELIEKMEKLFKDQSTELDEKLEKGFKNQKTELDEKLAELDEKLEKGFKNQSTEFDRKVGGLGILIEALRKDLKIFDEDTSEEGAIPLARRVTSLEVRVKKLEGRKRPQRPAR